MFCLRFTKRTNHYNADAKVIFTWYYTKTESTSLDNENLLFYLFLFY